MHALADGILRVAGGDEGRRFSERVMGLTPTFLCVLAHTDTCLIPGVSAAGASASVRHLTPAADAEAVVWGRPRCLPTLPSNPLGPPGPAGITRAAVVLARLRTSFVCAGLRVYPDVPHQRVESAPGGSLGARGPAVPQAWQLFQRGWTLGSEVCLPGSYLVLAESVPGGTTTALAVLVALGYQAYGRTSGSGVGNAHALKIAIVQRALARAGWRPGDGRRDPLNSTYWFGDPMQPLATGILLGAVSRGVDVLLAGGCQMLAVAAIAAAVDPSGAWVSHTAIGTTRWVVRDPWSDVAGLAHAIHPRLAVLAADLDFSHSAHPELQLYESFLVKEGVGAGGAALAALLSGHSRGDLHQAIDATYAPLLAADRTIAPAPQSS